MIRREPAPAVRDPHAGRGVTRTVWPPALVVVVVALISAACSGAPAETGTGTGGGDTVARGREQAVAFAACMRANGVREFPDPDASGELTLDGVANRSSLDVDTVAFKQAIEACKDQQPPGFTGRKRNAEQQESALRFARCVRDHGVKDFPDPAPDAPLVDTNRIPSAGTTSGMGTLNAAMKTCGDLVADLVKGS
jgi:hypothetical protein